MKKFIKSGIVIMLSAVLILSQVAPMSFADRDNGKSQQKIEKKMNQKEYDPKLKAELRERLQTMYRFGSDAKWANLPSGMFKQGYLNYGLAKRYFNGQFPAGLAKKLADFHYEDHHAVLLIADLDKLIVSAKSKLDVSNTKVYFPDPGAKTALQSAIKIAEEFVKANPTALEKDIKVQFEALKLAMFTFDNSENLASSATHLTKLNELLAKLNLYKTKYLYKLSSTRLAALEALITNIKQYTVVTPIKVLTLGAYNEIMMQGQKFEDPITKLDVLIGDIEAFLYVDPTLAIKAYKVSEGTAEGKYIAGSIAKIEAAVVESKAFSLAYLNQSVNQIDTQYSKLNKSFTEFKNSVILGADHLLNLKLVRDELQFYYTKNFVAGTKPLTELAALIAEMNPIIATPSDNPLTHAKLAYFMDASKNYIKDLYDTLKLELKAKINQASLAWAVTAKPEAVEAKAELNVRILAAQAYLAGTTHTYLALFDHINLLTAAIQKYADLND